MQILKKNNFLVILLFLLPTSAWADAYTETIEIFKKAGASGEFFGKAYGYAVFPNIGKAGVGIGGARGKGKVFVNGVSIGETTMTQLSVGLQFGGQAFSQIIFFEDKRALNEFISGNFAFGANASAVAITAGVSASANTTGGAGTAASGGKNDATTTGEYYRGMAIFTVAKGGLMYEATVGGQKFSFKAAKAN
jgi:lipid-binding SYLF domain-containing protein